jgi:ABC-type cobalamin/Fe3+-siderophores transport system ATPase subunit
MILRADHLRFAYRPDRPVLQDVSLSLAPGRICVLLGPNGSGKSTLLRLLLGHLPTSAGTIEWDGKALCSLRPGDLARLVAYLPQAPAYELGQTVAEVLRVGRTPYLGPFGTESPRDLQVVRDAADLLELTDLLDRPVDELSGGQRQRVFLGRALAQEPRAFLLDEPNTFLDLRHQANLWQLLRRLARERNLAILAASHDLNLSAAFADELLLLHGGRLIAAGPPADVLRPELLSRAYGLDFDRLDRPGKTPVVFPTL